MPAQDWRDFLSELDTLCPEKIIREKQEICPEYEITAYVLEHEKKKSYPVLLFENVKGKDFPVVANLLATRERLALAMGVQAGELSAEFSSRITNRLPPRVLPEAPFYANRWSGRELDIARLPVLTHFPVDAGPYVTAGLVVAKDPYTGAETLGYHRMQYKGPDKLGISLHSRQRLWEYQRRAEERGVHLEAAVVLGLHPNISLGSMALIPYGESKYPAIGGVFGEPLELAPCRDIDLLVPAWAEIVIEGEILSGVREPEGPFAEFTGYACHRSTENVFRARSISFRENALYQCITPGLCAEHITIVAVQREGDVLAALKRTLPNIKSVHAPLSSCGLFHCYIAMRKIAEGQATQAIYSAFSVDHNIKMVVVVDDDIDIFDEADVLWAMATRLQADRGVLVVPQQLGMGCTLDPSTDDKSRTARMGIDATRPLEGFAGRIAIDPAVRARIRKKYFGGSY